jgi:RNA polymerase sigma factor (sigma-70 family)
VDTVRTPRLRPALSRRPLRFADDERLVAQIRSGSERAFEDVYDRHHAGILSFCRHMLGSREEAEDVVQQTFASAYSALLDDQRKIALKPWLYAIARNGCLSALRGQREHVALEDAGARLPATAGLSVEVEQREDLRALLRDLQRLPEDQRAALILAELGAETHEEIALVLGVPAVKIRALVFQAREALMSRRLARETDCEPIREQLAFVRGGALRRRELRQHVAQCAGCQAFEADVHRQRAGMAVLLPVAPTLALKQSSLAAAFAAGGSGAATAGGAAAVGVGTGGVAAAGGAAGGATAGGAAAGSAAAGGAASVGGATMLSGGGALVGAKIVAAKALIGLALTGGVTAGGYTVLQAPKDASAPPVHAGSSASNSPQKVDPKPPASGVAVPADVDECRKRGGTAGQCTRTSTAPLLADARTGDRDGDGVANREDQCPNQAGTTANGCAQNAPTDPLAADPRPGDRDGDGVPNRKDPDRDGDGVANREDECPNQAGMTANGCAQNAPTDPLAADRRPGDRDGDGVPNRKDSDRDGDGVANREDKCPNQAGTTANGCPPAPASPIPPAPRDRDGDGVANREDKCPNQAGTTADGCAQAAPTDPLPAVPRPGDLDGDGVPNGQDDDRDGDGVPNRQDDDRDGDGVPNREDACPGKAGMAADGCPQASAPIPPVPTPLVP